MNTDATPIVETLHVAAKLAFDTAREDAARALRDLIAIAGRELRRFEHEQSVNTDWIEQDAARYHDALTKCTAAGQMLAGTEWALRNLKGEN